MNPEDAAKPTIHDPVVYVEPIEDYLRRRIEIEFRKALVDLMLASLRVPADLIRPPFQSGGMYVPEYNEPPRSSFASIRPFLLPVPPAIIVTP